MCSGTACSPWACSAGPSPTGPGLLGRALTDWAGAGNLTNYKVRFTKQTWPGETLTTTVVVTAKREEAGQRLVDVDASLANQDGEIKVTGSATVIAA